MTKLDMAMRIAIHAHETQKDKSGEPYILHPLHLMTQFKDETSQIVAVLHDVVEDSDYTLRSLALIFSEDIIAALDGLTHRKEEDYFEYIERIRTSAVRHIIIPIKIADLRHNSDISRLLYITEKDIQRMEKYNKALGILEREIINV